MIRKYKALVKSWELERPKQVIPFPDGIVAQTASAPAGCTPDQWTELMSSNSRWPSSADATGWAVELAGIARATEELSLVVDIVLARTEAGDVLQRWVVDLLLVQLAALLSCWDRRENHLRDKFLPWLESRVGSDGQKALQHLRRCYDRRRKRTDMLRAALEKARATTEGGEKDKGTQVYAMRCAKESYDVFQSVSLVSTQLEVEAAMLLTRKHATEAEFNEQWVRPAASTRRSVLRPGALATLGSERGERLSWLRSQGVPDWLGNVYLYGIFLMMLGTWRRPMEALMANKKQESALGKLFKSQFPETSSSAPPSFNKEAQ